MVSSRIGVFILSIAIATLMLSGCSDDPTAREEENILPSLGSGVAFSEWSLVGEKCASGQFCLSHVAVSYSSGVSPEIHARGTGESGLFSQSTSMTFEDYDGFANLVESVLAVRGNAPEGCTPDKSVIEVVSNFSGCVGFSAQIEGCDDPVVQQVREQAEYLFTKYFAEH